jgi:hypothetical protein
MFRLCYLAITLVNLPHADGVRETRLMFESTREGNDQRCN